MPRRKTTVTDDNKALSETLDRTVEDGMMRVKRSLPSLLATGLVGGTDVAVGVLAMLVVEEATGSHLLGSLAFTVGFIALTLAGSELFTENFLVPVAAVVAREASILSVVRLWAGTLVMNLVAGWIVMGVVVSGLPRLSATAVEMGSHYPAIGIGWRSFAGALLGGAVITLMTWMERSTESVPAKLVASIAGAFLLVAAPLNHVIVTSLEMFGALHAGAPFGYADWATVIAWYALGNMIGGLLFVTALRMVQVSERISERRAA